MKDEHFEFPPRPDPPEEPSHRAARIADRDRGEERGDVEDESLWQRVKDWLDHGTD